MQKSDWFPHDADASTDPKMLSLLSIRGMTGYGMFWSIVEILRLEKDYKLELEPYVFNATAMRLLTTPEQAQSFIEECINQHKLFVSDGKCFWSNSMIDRMSTYDKVCKTNSKNASKGWKKRKKDATAMRPQCDRVPIQGNSIHSNSNKDHRTLALEAFEEMSIQIGKPLNNTSRQLIMKSLFDISKDPTEQAKIIEQSVANRWTSFQPLRIVESQKQKPKYWKKPHNAM